ncbi:DinB family protein [Pseudoclavibacter chungangensis]|uniref:DinB family protein n=1 Tax=Pseudoclavibacter chungangensis TaxID=587635 RepID=A0A7J5BP05_9MICO|nr:DinB family protein [Pseudoclavibacter chungangensis]KAB1654332.1 DinB family protein [Pseudoclavibacter chungangensis]NYJ65249.1 putative damage-inducible protein DinB [Pseudoclavibacter chungangensis]
MDVVFDEQGRPEPPVDGDEWATLVGFLEFHRATLAWKVSGLDREQFAHTLPPSSMTLGGLVKHLTLVEDDWFERFLLAAPPREPWASVDWTATPDWEWESALVDEPADLVSRWQQAVERSRRAARDAFVAGGLGHRAATSWSDGRTPNLRWIVTHMIEEYARHNGHADLLREAIDGQVGE